VRLFHTVENRVILNVQHGEVDVDDLADYVKVGSRSLCLPASSLPLGAENDGNDKSDIFGSPE
jgi:hypothetical protein